LMKNLQDYMTKLRYYSDDSQIVWLESKKFNSEKNRIEIEITEV
ncbi:RusA family crossover junction endodeoxyribonuclease, partial [Lactococcus hircilactis]